MLKKSQKRDWKGSNVKAEYCGRSFSGQVIDETKNTLIIKTEKNQTKKIINKDAIITLDGDKISGKEITKRPQDRIKA